MHARTVVVGDVHGCLDELKELIFDVVKIKSSDRLVLLGDLIDRGPDSAGVVDFAYHFKAECIMGNHEEKALRWRLHEFRRKVDPAQEYKNPMRSIRGERLAQWASIPNEQWDWISQWPKFTHINETWTGVHAGCMPDVAIENQVPNELMRLRYIKLVTDPKHGYIKHKMASLKATGEPPDPKEGEAVVHWSELWSGPRNIVYGHYIWDNVHITGNPVTGAKTVGIDTGCVHGGFLTALVFEGDELYPIQVKAKKTYVERKLWTDEE